MDVTMSFKGAMFLSQMRDGGRQMLRALRIEHEEREGPRGPDR